MGFFNESQSRVLMLLLCISSVTVFCFLNGQISSNPFWDFYKYAHAILNETSSDVIPSCDCHTCMTEPGDDAWFVQRFSKSPIYPFLTKANMDVTGNTIKWWKRMQKDRGDFGKAVEELFQVIPDELLYLDAGPDRCRTCAVVGNSGNLMRSHYGAHIDLNDVIIRINNGSTKGYEEDVGTRTTHHIMYPESAVDLDNTTHLVLFPFKTRDLQWLRSIFTPPDAQNKSRIKANKDLALVLNPAFMRYVHEVWLQKHGLYPSTGIMAIILAIHICDQVNVYGFGADRYGNWNHYWDPAPTRRRIMNSNHGRGDESKAITELSKRQKVQMFRGW